MLPLVGRGLAREWRPIPAGRLALARLDLIGAVSGVLALGISSVQVCHELSHAPRTTATNAGSELGLQYDPRDRSLHFEFPVLLQNAGRADDVLESVSASLLLSNENTSRSLSDSMAIEGDAKLAVTLPYPVPVGSRPLSISVRADAQITASLASGQSRLNLILKTHSRELPAVDYCFELNAELLDEMRSAHRLWHKHMRNTDCAAGSSESPQVQSTNAIRSAKV